MLFDAAYSSKKNQLEGGSLPNSPLYDKLIFESLRAKLGGR